MTPTQENREEEEPKGGALPRSPREGCRNLGSPNSPTPGGRRSRPLLEGTAFCAAAVFPPPSGGCPTLHLRGRLTTPPSVRKVLGSQDHSEPKAPQVSDWEPGKSIPGPRDRDAGVRARFRAAVPLPVAERLRSGRLLLRRARMLGGPVR